MSRDVDLRVHYSAPSARSDDERYLAQANAYTNFVALRTLMIAPSHSIGPPANEIADTVVPHTSSGFVEETQAAILALDSQLVRATPPPQTSREKRALEVVTDESYGADSSGSVSKTNSSYLHSPILDRSAKRQKIGHRRSCSVVGTLTKTAHNTSQQNYVAHGAPQVPSDWSTSQLPTSYSLSDDTSNRSKQAARSIQRSVSDPGPVRDNNKIAGELTIVADASTESEASRVETIGAGEQFRMITPPSPQVGIVSFQSHVTERLQYLRDSPKLTSVLEAISPSRTIDNLERGHWLFSITSWSHTSQLELWSFLEGFVQSGAAGCGIWGTWSSKDGDSMVKAYCWGEIVLHTYLLLYVASRSNIRKSQLQWIDAAGQTVITVEPR